jgi:very-short-patch-repair endonuclease
MTRPRVDHEMREKARSLRKILTRGEVLLWLELRALRRAGLHFRKQVPIGPYIADFSCLRAKLIVEVDGDAHESEKGKRHDANRDAYLRSLGYEIMRFDEPDVRSNPWNVAQLIKQHAAFGGGNPTRPLRGHPPQGGEGTPPIGYPERATEDPHP